jgi:hypothetical protein
VFRNNYGIAARGWGPETYNTRASESSSSESSASQSETPSGDEEGGSGSDSDDEPIGVLAGRVD